MVIPVVMLCNLSSQFITTILMGSNNFKFSESHMLLEISAVFLPFRTCRVKPSEFTVKSFSVSNKLVSNNVSVDDDRESNVVKKFFVSIGIEMVSVSFCMYKVPLSSTLVLECIMLFSFLSGNLSALFICSVFSGGIPSVL